MRAAAIALVAAVALTWAVVGSDAAAAPTGRAWTPVEAFRVPGHTRLIPDVMMIDSAGIPTVFAAAVGGIGRDAYAVVWSESTWVPRWNLGQAISIRLMMAPGRRRGLVWSTPAFDDPQLGFRQWIVVSEDLGHTAAAPESVAHHWAGHYSYGGAMSTRRRWVAFGDNYQSHNKLFYSDSARIWRSIPVPGDGSSGIAMTVVDDTTALLAWGNNRDPSGIRWGYVRGTRFEEGPMPPEQEFYAPGAPVWRTNPDGGWYLFWVTHGNHISRATLRGTTWSDRDSLFADYQPPGTYYTDAANLEVVPDSTRYPLVGWSAHRATNYAQVFCVAHPTESGFGLGEQLDTPENAALPRTTTDRNGDVWTAWGTNAVEGMYFFHTYVTATAGAPVIVGTPKGRLVSWTLSSPAPGSWWAVLRARDSQPFVEVARVRAGDSQEMSWADLFLAGGARRYRIRRESVDTRYEWLGEETLSPVDLPPPSPSGGPLSLSRTSPNPADAALRFEILNASAGPLEAQVYDLRGRLLFGQRLLAVGTGRDPIVIDPEAAGTRIPPGLFFLRATDSAGKVSQSVKFVFLR